MRRRLVRIVLGAALVVGGLYLALVLAAFVFQRSLLYFPDPQERAPDPSGPPVEVVRLATDDGERLVAWHMAPRDDGPVFLFFNGNGARLAAEGRRLREIEQAGAGILAVAFRGYDGSTGKPTEQGLHADARAAYAWLTARYPPERIVIHGYSLGSGPAVRLAAERPARALVLEAPFTSTLDVASSKFGWLPRELLLDRYRSDRLIGRVRMPVLVVHGDADEVIPQALGRRLYALAPAPKRFVSIPGGGHNTLVGDGLYPHVWRFLGPVKVQAP